MVINILRAYTHHVYSLIYKYKFVYLNLCIQILFLELMFGLSNLRSQTRIYHPVYSHLCFQI
mgnify:CR=1 FL=1